MATKNIEMNYLSDEYTQQYDVLYPKTNSSLVIGLLDDSTKQMYGLDTNATPDDIFQKLYTASYLGDKCFFKLKLVYKGTNTPVENVAISSSNFKDSASNPVSGPLYTDENGEITTYFTQGNVTLNLKGYADMQDHSQSYDVKNGQQYTYTWEITTVNYKRWDSSATVMLSSNVETIDVSCVGGGGGGAGTFKFSARHGSGGGGGYVTKQNISSFNINSNYSIVIGAGGEPGGTYGDDRTSAGLDGGTSSFLSVEAKGGSGAGPFGGSGNGDGGDSGIGISSSSDISNDPKGKNGEDGTITYYASYTLEELVSGGGGGGSAYDSYSAQGRDKRYYGGSGGAPYGGKGGDGYYQYSGGRPGGLDPSYKNGQGYGGGGGGAGISLISGETISYEPGKGYQGCVAIRMHLKVTSTDSIVA